LNYTMPVMQTSCIELDPTSGLLSVLTAGRALLQNATAEVRYRAGDTPYVLRLTDPGVVVDTGTGPSTVRRADGQLEATWHVAPPPRPSPGDGGGAGGGAVGGVFLRLTVRNVGGETVRLDALHVLSLVAADGGSLDLGMSVGELSFYHHGWQSWSPVFTRHVADGLYLDPATPKYQTMHVPYPVPAQPKTLVSAWVTVLSPRTDDTVTRRQGDKVTDNQPITVSPCHRVTVSSLLVGFVSAADQLSEVRLQVDGDVFGRLDAVAYVDGVPLAPGETFASEVLWVTMGDDPVILLERWADELGRQMGARVPDLPPTGWCTWYYYFGTNTDHDVLSNLAKLRDYDLPLDTVLIDDGYETAIGDWLSTDDKFPDGLAPVTRAIQVAGKTPGLWLAPFAASAVSRLAVEHPDWLLRDDAGQPVVAWEHFIYGTIYALDTTHPGVLDWLHELFRTLHDDFGFAWFKLDFIYAAALPGQRFDPRATRAQAFRRGLGTIRDAVGDRFLLGCGAPQAASVGLVDAMRIGPDVHSQWDPFWPDLSMPALVNAARNIVTRSFMHRRLWINDPDCVLIRRRDDASELVLNEMRTLVTLAGLSGGLIVSSDNLTTLAPGRLKYLRQVLPPWNRAAVPIDLFQNELPQVLVLPIERDWGRWWVVGLINWGDKTTETTVELADLGLDTAQRYHVFNYWRRRYLGTTQARFTARRHQPHETALLLFKPVSDRPELLTSTFHVTQGAVEVAGGRWQVEDQEVAGCRLQVAGRNGSVMTLRVALAKAGRQAGQLLFSVPRPWQVTGARVDGRRRGVVRVSAGVVGLGFELREKATVELDCRVGQEGH
jgi:alpha-galactosidase